MITLTFPCEFIQFRALFSHIRAGFLLLVVLWMMPQILTAQEAGMTRLGVHVSPNLSWMHAMDNQNILMDKQNLTFTIGFQGEYYLSSVFAIASGVNLAFNQGAKLGYAGNYDQANFFTNSDLSSFDANLATIKSSPVPRVRYHHQYVELPLAIKMRSPELGSSLMHVFIHAPVFTFGFRTQARASITGEDMDGRAIDVSRINTTDDARLLNISWGAGGGIEYLPNDERTALLIGIFYQGGLMDQTRPVRVDNTDVNYNIRVSNVALRLGVLF